MGETQTQTAIHPPPQQVSHLKKHQSSVVSADAEHCHQTGREEENCKLKARPGVAVLSQSALSDSCLSVFQEDCESEIDIISIYSNSTYTDERCPVQRDFRITPTSQFKFFSRKYSYVFIIDLSTSLTNVVSVPFYSKRFSTNDSPLTRTFITQPYSRTKFYLPSPNV